MGEGGDAEGVGGGGGDGGAVAEDGGAGEGEAEGVGVEGVAGLVEGAPGDDVAEGGEGAAAVDAFVA